MNKKFYPDVLLRNFRSEEDVVPNARPSVTRKKTFLKLQKDSPIVEEQEKILKEKKLLPILHYKYNLREIVKQIILLEDHLINEKKQCHDCIIKHFLAIEALSEEALTLNKNLTKDSPMYSLPDEIRKLQRLWYDNKETKTIETAQALRKIRKVYMEDSFNIIFDDNLKEGSCSSKSCHL